MKWQRTRTPNVINKDIKKPNFTPPSQPKMQQVQQDKQYDHITTEDISHLKWIRNRMVHVHIENPGYDYMRALDKIIHKLYNPEPIKTCAGCEHEGIQVNPYSPCANCIRWVGVEDSYTPKTGDE